MSGSSGGNDKSDWRPEPKAPESRKGGPGGGAGEGGRAPPDPCNVIETTTLNSPDRTVIAILRVGDTLQIVFQPGPPRRLVAQHGSGSIAGSITSPAMLQIIECITQ